MRKRHYKVVLEVTTTETGDVDGADELEGMDFWTDDGEGVDIQDVTVKSVEVIK